jgi:hypothetical protein
VLSSRDWLVSWQLLCCHAAVPCCALVSWQLLRCYAAVLCCTAAVLLAAVLSVAAAVPKAAHLLCCYADVHCCADPMLACCCALLRWHSCRAVMLLSFSLLCCAAHLLCCCAAVLCCAGAADVAHTRAFSSTHRSCALAHTRRKGQTYTADMSPIAAELNLAGIHLRCEPAAKLP